MVTEESLIRTAPVLFDIVSRDGRIVYANETEERELGFRSGMLKDAGYELVYPLEAREAIDRVLSGEAESPQRFVRLQLRSAERKLVDVAANIDLVEMESEGVCARIVKFALGETLARLDHLARENELLSSIVSTARDASYCVDYVEPVDLTAPEHEVIRQVFENQCIWRYCNEAMARLYKLPIGGNLNERDVREVFRRNPDNEAFVRRLIASRWTVDSALSRDMRYDGVEAMIENDVRADIRNGQLHRFWGVVREVSARRMHERELESQALEAFDILAAVADPVLVLDADAVIVGANPAVEWALGWRADDLMGRKLRDLLRVPADLSDAVRRAEPGRFATKLEGTAQRRDGGAMSCTGFLSQLPGETNKGRCVMTLRVAPYHGGVGQAS